MHLIQGSINPDFLANRLTSYQTDSKNGAHSIFLGQVRSDQEGENFVIAIDYHAYHEMAEKIIAEKINIIKMKHHVSQIEVYHSYGHVNVGEYSVLIIVNSGHRKASLNALSEIVELIKYDVPIWKKEIYSNGKNVWVNEQQKREINA